MSMQQWVHDVADELERVVVVSPHFDDAVMGAGYLIAGHPGTTVITVFGGRPPKYPETPTEWDALGGFEAGDDIVALRRGEDVAALGELGAMPHWLEFSDHQYLDKSDWYSAEDVAPTLAAALRHLEPTSVFVPFGLANPDHDLTHRAARIVMNELQDVAWYCYEDGGYCNLPGLLAWRISALFRSGLWPTPAIVPVSLDPERKHRALSCYRSQLPPLRADHLLDAREAAPVPEQYWRLGRPPDGWEGLVDVPG